MTEPAAEPAEPVDGVDPLEGHRPVDPHRRRASHLYGLIVSGAVLATAPDALGTVRVAVLLLGTLVVYWMAETYVHWIASRTLHGRDLTGPERRQVLRDGVPLVAACTVPVLVLVGEGVLQVPTDLAVRIALLVNTALLLAVGWNMSTASGLRGGRRLLSAAMTGLLGVAMVALKVGLH